MKTMIVTALFAALGAIGVARSEVPMQKVAAGERSGISVARQVVVRSDAEWRQLWHQHASRQPIPKVDFALRMVVGVFLGTRPTSGFSVQIVEVREEQDALVARYAERAPSPNAMVLQVLTSPFSMVSVPARVGDVRFERTAVPRRRFR